MQQDYVKQLITSLLGTQTSPNKEPYRLKAIRDMREMQEILSLSLYLMSTGIQPQQAVNDIFSYKAADFLVANNYRVDDNIKNVIFESSQRLKAVRSSAMAAANSRQQRMAMQMPGPNTGGWGALAQTNGWPPPPTPQPSAWDGFGSVTSAQSVDNGDSPVVPAYIQKEREKNPVLPRSVPTPPPTTPAGFIESEVVKPATEAYPFVKDPVTFEKGIIKMDINDHMRSSHLSPHVISEKELVKELSELSAAAALTDTPESVLDPGVSLDLPDTDTAPRVIVTEAANTTFDARCIIDIEWMAEEDKLPVESVTVLTHTQIKNDNITVLDISTLIQASGIMGAIDFLNDLLDKAKENPKYAHLYNYIFSRWDAILTDMMIDVLEYLTPGLLYDGDPDSFYGGIVDLIEKDMSEEESSNINDYITNWVCTYDANACTQTDADDIYQSMPTVYIDGDCHQLGIQFATRTEPLILSEYLHKELVKVIRTTVAKEHNWRCRIVLLDSIYAVYLSPMDKDSLIIRPM